MKHPFMLFKNKSNCRKIFKVKSFFKLGKISYNNFKTFQLEN